MTTKLLKNKIELVSKLFKRFLDPLVLKLSKDALFLNDGWIVIKQITPLNETLLINAI